MRTPFLGAHTVARSLNLADQQCINLFAELVDTKSGKDVGALFMCPGLDLFAQAGNGPIRGLHVLFNSGNPILYVVSGNSIYSVTTAMVVTLLGSITTTSGPVSIIDNGTQVAFFDSSNAYLVPGGFPLTGGGIGSGGSGYQVGDTINLTQTGGTQTATAVATVLTLSGSAVATYSITTPGAFNPKPTSFSQNTTSGSGSGFTITSPTFGSSVGVYTIPVPFSVPVIAIEQDGFGVVAQANSSSWFQSNLNDLSIWQALNFATSAAKPDSVIALADIHREIFVLKQTNFEVWVNVGNAGFTFQRIDGVFPEIGCVAPFSVAKAGESLIWLSQNDQGQGIVVRAEGYIPKRISTHAIEFQIAQLSTISDAIAYVHQVEGHVFYVLIFPTGNLSLCYDTVTELWHQRAAFSNGAFSRHISNCGAFFNGKYVVGDFQNGNIYAYDMNTQTDNGALRVWLRSWRALQKPTNQPVRFNSLQIDMQTGMGVPAGTNPQVMLRWSDDGGHNWSNQRFAAAGQAGQTANRVKFNRLGSTRRNSGLDRIFELSSSDAFNVALIGADMEAG